MSFFFHHNYCVQISQFACPASTCIMENYRNWLNVSLYKSFQHPGGKHVFILEFLTPRGKHVFIMEFLTPRGGGACLYIGVFNTQGEACLYNGVFNTQGEACLYIGVFNTQSQEGSMSLLEESMKEYMYDINISKI